jgi:hypothetical protein
MNKLLIVALVAACAVNVVCLCATSAVRPDDGSSNKLNRWNIAAAITTLSP